MSQILEISRTNSHIYSVVVLPKEATNINIPMKKNKIHMELWYSTESGQNIKHGLAYITIPSNSELLGILNETLTEEQAREIVVYLLKMGGYKDYEEKEFVYHSALGSLTSLVESKGIETTQFKIVIIKSEI